jgi:carbon-monoxide dehydrogenase small subunit
MKQTIQLTVNGHEWEVDIEPRQLLVDVLRDQLGLWGAKRACQDSYCGACTVLLDGKAVHSCCVLAIAVRGQSVTTVEGLAQGDELSPVQQVFVDHAAAQCGFCTPGMVMAATALLSENPQPSEAEVRHYLTGNLCRCTGYNKIVEAILDAAR